MLRSIFYLQLMMTVFQNQICCHPQKEKIDVSGNAVNVVQTEDQSLPKGTHWCKMSINRTSALYLQNNIEEYKPNFARLELRFRYVHPVVEPYILEPSTSHTEEIIQPYQWVWTYYLPTGFFSYIKWPVDFPILSFGLLEAKTLRKQFLVVEISDPNCSVTMGNLETTYSVANALRDLTNEYLLHIKKAFSYSYWCYLAEIPGVKDTLGYQFGIYLAYPVEFARYNCCRTEQSVTNETRFSIHCSKHQLKKMWQGTIIPYILGLVAFGYFPIVLFSWSANMVTIGKNGRCREFDLMSAADDDNDEKNFAENWIFLDGKPPICLTTLIFGFCGLAETHPVTVSRLRRLIFILLGPCVIFCELYVYYTFQYETTMALIDHGCPMGYLSMLGGFEKSRNNFQPILGGPYCLIMVFYVAGFIFLISPTYPDGVVFDGTVRYSSFGEMSPLFLDITTIEGFSHLSIANETCGYRRVAALNTALFYTLVNPKFWWYSVRIQLSRFRALLTMCTSMCVKVIFSVLILPIYIVICVAELFLCIVYYGIPMINAMCIIVTGYVVWMIKFLRRRSDRSASLFWGIFNSYACKFVLVSIMTCLFIYYMFSFCTIFILSFAFISEVLVFSFISVIVYPTTSFGYLFFGIVFFYYIFKTFQGLGNTYLELLADTVEISYEMENDMYKNPIIDGTLIINDSTPVEITKIQISHRVINLSTNQRQAIREVNIDKKPKLVYRKHVAGIPRDLFYLLVKKYFPVHIQITHALLRICLILALIYVTISIVVVKPYSPTEGISEMMHVVFIVAIGALPRVLEVAMDNINHHVKKEIHLREIKATVHDYWINQLKED
ncbi:uncharacterized protein LOC123524079 [Mercenaria mercenaria]|uniref:uncharacterized protein LOC123524079 n=1 Tax=Mercenaria mercenaria TaxID=6596 RepID=UPI00234F2828|nr:uncharacterized protein LOC123524079 [Mercenaria mercenaria]